MECASVRATDGARGAEDAREAEMQLGGQGELSGPGVLPPSGPRAAVQGDPPPSFGGHPEAHHSTESRLALSPPANRISLRRALRVGPGMGNGGGADGSDGDAGDVGATNGLASAGGVVSAETGPAAAGAEVEAGRSASAGSRGSYGPRLHAGTASNVTPFLPADGNAAAGSGNAVGRQHRSSEAGVSAHLEGHRRAAELSDFRSNAPAEENPAGGPQDSGGSSRSSSRAPLVSPGVARSPPRSPPDGAPSDEHSPVQDLIDNTNGAARYLSVQCLPDPDGRSPAPLRRDKKPEESRRHRRKASQLWGREALEEAEERGRFSLSAFSPKSFRSSASASALDSRWGPGSPPVAGSLGRPPPMLEGRHAAGKGRASSPSRGGSDFSAAHAQHHGSRHHAQAQLRAQSHVRSLSYHTGASAEREETPEAPPAAGASLHPELRPGRVQRAQSTGNLSGECVSGVSALTEFPVSAPGPTGPPQRGASYVLESSSSTEESSQRGPLSPHGASVSASMRRAQRRERRRRGETGAAPAGRVSRPLPLAPESSDVRPASARRGALDPALSVGPGGG